MSLFYHPCPYLCIFLLSRIIYYIYTQINDYYLHLQIVLACQLSKFSRLVLCTKKAKISYFYNYLLQRLLRSFKYLSPYHTCVRKCNSVFKKVYRQWTRDVAWMQQNNHLTVNPQRIAVVVNLGILELFYRFQTRHCYSCSN